MTSNGPMYVVGREPSTRRDYAGEEKQRLRSIVDQLTAAVADTEADVEKARAEATAEIAQLRRTTSEVEALLAAERETTASLRDQLAAAEQQRLSAESARDEAVHKQQDITDDYESRLREACQERDAERANVAARDQTIAQLEAASVSDRERHDAAVAQLRQQLEQLTSEALRWSSVVQAVERVLAAQPADEGDRSGSAINVTPPLEPPTPVDEDDEPLHLNDLVPASSPPPVADAAAASAALPDPIDTYVRQLLGTAEQMYEMDRDAGRPAVEIVDRLVAHLRYARDLVVRRVVGTADGNAVFRRVLSALLNERSEQEFGRNLASAVSDLYGDSKNAEKLA
ncbi:MAG TPA: hypothetical protein VKE51_20030 [Vicinamibacterales bacterium]|nr:hypothetical protein [Vicinamibacterales bacterium]